MHKYEQAGPAKKVGIVGARGYSGLELARLLLQHPGADLKACFAGEQAFALSDYLPEAAAASVPVKPLSELTTSGLDVIFLATPAEVSVELAPKILAAGIHCVDLSGAFRLATPADYTKWYGFSHPDAALLEQAHYGLVPFAQPKPSSKATLVSNPGCYATSVLLALIPLLQEGVIDPARIAIDAKSGTSGAGKKAAENLLFTEVEGDCLPYKVGKHQHLPEIIRWAGKLGGATIDPFFATHLLPVRRGIISAIYADLKKDAPTVGAAFQKAYGNYPLVRYGEIKDPKNLALKRVVGTARTQLQYQVVGNKLYLFSLLDNLLKGAASQAVENFNGLAGLPVETGLVQQEGIL